MLQMLSLDSRFVISHASWPLLYFVPAESRQLWTCLFSPQETAIQQPTALSDPVAMGNFVSACFDHFLPILAFFCLLESKHSAAEQAPTVRPWLHQNGWHLMQSFIFWPRLPHGVRASDIFWPERKHNELNMFQKLSKAKKCSSRQRWSWAGEGSERCGFGPW